MHSFLAAIFAVLFSFSHTSAVQPTAAPPAAAPQPYIHTVATVERIPSRTPVAHLHSGTVYPEQACVSCRRMNVTYRAR